MRPVLCLAFGAALLFMQVNTIQAQSPSKPKPKKTAAKKTVAKKATAKKKPVGKKKVTEAAAGRDTLTVKVVKNRAVESVNIENISFFTPPQIEPVRKMERSADPANEIYEFADESAKMPDSFDLQKTLVYPPAARDARVEGSVVVRFVVEKDGSISNVKAETSLPMGCNQAAMDAVKKMPKWEPARMNGLPVRTWNVVTLRFKLPE